MHRNTCTCVGHGSTYLKLPSALKMPEGNVVRALLLRLKDLWSETERKRGSDQKDGARLQYAFVLLINIAGHDILENMTHTYRSTRHRVPMKPSFS